MTETTADALRPANWSNIRSGFILFFGVALPLIALIVELTQRFNASVFFDPIPTLGHVLLVAFVAISNGYCWFVCRFRGLAQVRVAAFANGVAIAGAAFYTILFLPLLPLGAIMVLYFGLGALAWAPVLSFIVALRLRVHLARSTPQLKLSRQMWAGVAVGCVALVALEMPATLTRAGVRMATSNSAEERARGVHWLRAVGSEKVLLRMCYVRTGSTTDLMSVFINWKNPVSTETARQVYYRVTGRPFNSVPAPVDTNRADWDLFDANADQDLGGDLVGGRVRDLWLASSTIDGSVNAAAALGYLEWTMSFRNDSTQAREARAQIALPPGAVVSRVTLWVNGREQEAAFGGRNQVRQAYQAVVRVNRDPVLVTTAGTDRVNVQLFPVPVAGEMKVRIGITVPLKLMNAREGLLRLPYFNERNFDVRADMRHSVWIESKSSLQSSLAASTGANQGTLRAFISDDRMSADDATVVAARPEGDVLWSVDPRSQLRVIRQLITRDDQADRPQTLVLVIDGSAAMEDAAGVVAKQLEALPAGVSVRPVFAQDEQDLSEKIPTLNGAEAARKLVHFDYGGGVDNTLALVRGLDLAGAEPDSVLMWVHGAQPLVLQAELPLHQQLARGRMPARWLELQVAPGRNVIAESLDGVATIETLRLDDLARLFASWDNGGTQMKVQRERIDYMPEEMPDESRTSEHLARLWANEEVARLVREGAARRDEAVEIARDYQLVTSVSGAVVLETREQYLRAGLQPVPEGTVPTIPEPEEWALIIVALGTIVLVWWRRRGVTHARAA